MLVIYALENGFVAVCRETSEFPAASTGQMMGFETAEELYNYLRQHWGGNPICPPPPPRTKKGKFKRKPTVKQHGKPTSTK